MSTVHAAQTQPSRSATPGEVHSACTVDEQNSQHSKPPPSSQMSHTHPCLPLKRGRLLATADSNSSLIRLSVVSPANLLGEAFGVPRMPSVLYGFTLLGSISRYSHSAKSKTSRCRIKDEVFGAKRSLCELSSHPNSLTRHHRGNLSLAKLAKSTTKTCASDRTEEHSLTMYSNSRLCYRQSHSSSWRCLQ